jgi:hypothetical protein
VGDLRSPGTRGSNGAGGTDGEGFGASGRCAGGEDAARAHYWNEKDYKNSNWRWNEIRVPQLMGKIGNLLKAEIPAADVAKMIEIMKRSDWEHGPKLTRSGANQSLDGLSPCLTRALRISVPQWSNGRREGNRSTTGLSALASRSARARDFAPCTRTQVFVCISNKCWLGALVLGFFAGHRQGRADSKHHLFTRSLRNAGKVPTKEADRSESATYPIHNKR